ncbi:MAG: secretin and TonB N-terminal domain-containing protein [Gammaproteobacteria bacterium]
MHHTLRTQNTRRDRGPRRVTMLSLLLAMLLTAVPTAGAAADAELKATDLDIPAQALIPALNAFAEQSGLQLLYSAELAEGKTTRGVSGRLTPEQALQTLLEGTGLSYRFVDPGTVTLTRPDPLAALVAEARRPIDYAQVTEPTPDKPQAPAKKSEEGPTVLPEMTITASPLDDTGYSVFNATTATKTDTPIMETPVSIQVIPRQVIED